MYFNWLPTYDEYLTYIEMKKKQEIYEWEPKWYPHIEFLNQIATIPPYPRWEEYPDEGRFRLQILKKFLENMNDSMTVFDWKRAYFIRAKYDVEILLSEELELQSFPFDCQDLSIIMRENSQNMEISFIPEMRKLQFASIDPRYSVIDEWDMEAARIEFGETNAVLYYKI